jgi:hypothetical protein
MRRQAILQICLLALMLAAASVQPARADFELTDPKGRRILLKDDGTWRYVDAESAPATPASGADAAKPEVQADMALLLRIDAPGGCRFAVALTNTLPYEIGSLVPEFAVERANGIVYTSKLVGFTSLRPGNKQIRQMQFEGIGCDDIAKLRVLGGDRCEMGELNRFSDAKGRCLALVRVMPSELLKFEK